MPDRVAASLAPARVQIFIPTYNRAEKLQRAVESALAQTWADVDVVVLDNHSTDATVEVMARLGARSPRLRHVRHDRNIGMLANFNAIPALVDGDWFAMLTDDDFYQPEFVATALTCAEANAGVDLIACDAPTMVCGVASGSQLDYWNEGRYSAGTGVLKCLLGHYPIITNCLFRASLAGRFRFEPALGNTGDGFILTAVFAAHDTYVSRYVSGLWNNDGDNASSLQAFDPVLIANVAIAEYMLYRGLVREGRFARRWLAIAWFKRWLSVSVAADHMGFAKLRAATAVDSAFGPVGRGGLAIFARLHLIRLFTRVLSSLRQRGRARMARVKARHAR
jgi:glycosyltransferase involved in cell wall biosynthesis